MFTVNLFLRVYVPIIQTSNLRVLITSVSFVKGMQEQEPCISEETGVSSKHLCFSKINETIQCGTEQDHIEQKPLLVRNKTRDNVCYYKNKESDTNDATASDASVAVIPDQEKSKRLFENGIQQLPYTSYSIYPKLESLKHSSSNRCKDTKTDLSTDVTKCSKYHQDHNSILSKSYNRKRGITEDSFLEPKKTKSRLKVKRSLEETIIHLLKTKKSFADMHYETHINNYTSTGIATESAATTKTMETNCEIKKTVENKEKNQISKETKIRGDLSNKSDFEEIGRHSYCESSKHSDNIFSNLPQSVLDMDSAGSDEYNKIADHSSSTVEPRNIDAYVDQKFKPISIEKDPLVARENYKKRFSVDYKINNSINLAYSPPNHSCKLKTFEIMCMESQKEDLNKTDDNYSSVTVFFYNIPVFLIIDFDAFSNDCRFNKRKVEYTKLSFFRDIRLTIHFLKNKKIKMIELMPVFIFTRESIFFFSHYTRFVKRWDYCDSKQYTSWLYNTNQKTTQQTATNNNDTIKNIIDLKNKSHHFIKFVLNNISKFEEYIRHNKSSNFDIIIDIIQELKQLEAHLQRMRKKTHSTNFIKLGMEEIFDFHKKFFNEKDNLPMIVGEDTVEDVLIMVYTKLYENFKVLLSSMLVAYNLYLYEA
ncbi:hypothetical protein CDIK_2407 [Cucumispora dikerogammari]|nr:hypothetical protein CDIK_2407 [Cucumispora dikerogammari]